MQHTLGQFLDGWLSVGG